MTPLTPGSHCVPLPTPSPAPNTWLARSWTTGDELRRASSELCVAPTRPLVEKLSALLEIVGVRMREAWGGRDARRRDAVGRDRAGLRGRGVMWQGVRQQGYDRGQGSREVAREGVPME